jgi:hypothetical protein
VSAQPHPHMCAAAWGSMQHSTAYHMCGAGRCAGGAAASISCPVDLDMFDTSELLANDRQVDR